MKNTLQNILRRGVLGLFVIASVVALGPAMIVADELPKRPRDIRYVPLVFEPPEAADYRHTVGDGIPVFLHPSKELPLIQIIFYFKGGSDQAPPGKVGLASATGSLIRRGGTQKISAEDLDERLDFLATQVATYSGDTDSGAYLDTLTHNFDESFGLFLSILRTPGFQSDRVRLYKDERLELMKQRNDDASDILSREWDPLLYGREHYLGRVATQSSVEAITEQDLREFHRKIFHPGNLIIGVSGDFDQKTMLGKLERAVEGWTPGPKIADPVPPRNEFKPGLYRIEKDISQGKVILGLRTLKRDNPDAITCQVLDHILGGSGFTSRITSRVRSEEGLAYSAGTYFTAGVYFPGEFIGFFESKNRTVALALKIVLEEIDRIRTELVTEEELASAKAAFIEKFPGYFASKSAVVQLFVGDEATKRPRSYWKEYRAKIQAISRDDVLRVAKTYLHPNELAILVVGKWSEIEPGDLEKRANMKEFFDGKSTELPLRDPMSQEPLSE